MEKMKNIQAVLLDLDGTLTDPRQGITRCIEYALQKMGVTHQQPSLDWCIGPPLIESFEILLNTADKNMLEQALALYRERFADVGLYENTLYPDVVVGLHRLLQKGFRLYLATSKPQVYAERILAHFDVADYFSGVYGSELSGERSHKTDLIAYLIQQEAIDPESAMMVGDRKHDIIGARNNGVQTIAVAYGYGTPEELIQAQPAYLCNSFGTVVRLLLDQRRSYMG